jgi:hypothetical protein
MRKLPNIPLLVHIERNEIWSNIQNLDKFISSLQSTRSLYQCFINGTARKKTLGGFRLATLDDVDTLPIIDKSNEFLRWQASHTPYFKSTQKKEHENADKPKNWKLMSRLERLDFILDRDSKKSLEEFDPNARKR